MDGGITARPRHIVRALVAAVAAAAMALTLTACGPINAGSAGADAFIEAFEGADGVASVEASGSNDLPFTGSASATVVADAELSDSEVDDLVERISEFLRGYRGVGWAVALEAGPLRVGVYEEPERNERRLQTARDLLTVPHVVYANVGVRHDSSVVQVGVDEVSALRAGYEAARAAVDAFDITEGRSSASAFAGEDAAFVVDDDAFNGADPAFGAALDLFEAVTAQFALAGATVTPRSITIEAAGDGEVDAVRDFVATLPAAAGLDVSIVGGKTQRDPGATPEADAVAAALRDVPSVTKLTVGAGTVTVWVSSLTDVRAAFEAAQREPAFTQLLRFGVVTADFSRVFAPPAEYGEVLQIAESAASLPAFDQVDVDKAASGDFSLHVDGADEATLTAFAAALKPALAAGGWYVWLGAGGNVESFDAAEQIVLIDKPQKRTPEQQAFADLLVKVWNAA